MLDECGEPTIRCPVCRRFSLVDDWCTDCGFTPEPVEAKFTVVEAIERDDA